MLTTTLLGFFVYPHEIMQAMLNAHLLGASHMDVDSRGKGPLFIRTPKDMCKHLWNKIPLYTREL